MAELRSSVILDLAGNLTRRARAFGSSLEQLGTRGRRAMSGLSRGVGAASNRIDALGNRWTGLLASVGAIATARGVVTLDARLTQLGTQADLTEEQVASLKQRLFDVAQDPDIRIDPKELLGAVEGVVEMTGDIEFATENMRNFGLAIRATGTSGKDVGLLAAEFEKMGLTLEKDVLHALALLTEQGESGAFTLQNLAALGPRVITAYTALGRTGVPALRELGAALQVIRQGTGSSEQAATAFEAVLRVMRDTSKLKILQQGGIQVFDPEELEKGREVLRPINELMIEIIKNAEGRGTVLGRVFDAESIRAFNASLGEFTRTGKLESLRKFYEVQADGTELMADASRNAGTAAAGLTALGTAWDQFANRNLAGPLQDAADALDRLDPETMQQWLEVMKWTAAGLAGIWTINKIGRGVMGVRGMLRRGGGAAGALGGASATNPVPVWIVNPGFGGRGRGAVAASTTTRGRAARGVGRTRGSLGRAGGMALGGIVAWDVGQWIGGIINDAFVEGTPLGERIGEGIARALAAFGNEEAQRAIAAGEKAGTNRLDRNFVSRTALNATPLGAAMQLFPYTPAGMLLDQQQSRVDGKIEVEITERGARVRNVESGNPDVEFAARTGRAVDSP